MSKFLFRCKSSFGKVTDKSRVFLEKFFWMGTSITAMMLFLFVVNFPPADEAIAKEKEENLKKEFNFEALDNELLFSFEDGDVKNCSEKKNIEKIEYKKGYFVLWVIFLSF